MMDAGPLGGVCCCTVGIVRLRQGFLASQPLISQIVRQRMMPPQW